MDNEIRVFTDGASRGNPGPGGWGSIIDFGEDVHELGGADKKTTNNRMELSAISETLEFLDSKNFSGSKITFYTDSSYVANGVSVWINGWRRNNWKNKAGQEIANIDLWQKIDGYLNSFEVSMENVEGHAGIPANERADQIATSFADDSPDNLFVGQKVLYKVDLNDTSSDQKKASTKKRNNTKAYSYVSLVNGEFQTHSTWSDCENRVKGETRAKFRKTVSKEDEDRIKKEWGV
jgi:ribonuclease HI